MRTDSKRVMILGASLLQAYVIRHAKKLGYYTIAVDMNKESEGFADADECKVIDIVDQQACLHYARNMRIDGVLTAATDFGVVTASYIAKEMNLNGLDYNVAHIIKNKYLVRKVLDRAGVDNAPQFFEITEANQVTQLFNTLRCPVIVKPCDGSGSRAVQRVNDMQLLQSACEDAIKASLSHRALVETFITGQEYGAEAFVQNGMVHVLGIMKKYMTAPPVYTEIGHVMPCGLSGTLELKVRHIVETIIRALGINFGAVNMDLIIDAQECVYVVDIGARMGGNLIGSHIIPLATGVDYMGNIIRASVGDATDWTGFESICPISTAILALKPGIVQALPDFIAMQKGSILYIKYTKRLGDVIRPYLANQDSCGYVVATGITAEEAVSHAKVCKEQIDMYVHGYEIPCNPQVKILCGA